MKRFIAGADDEGRRLERWLKARAPALPPALMHKYMRLKRFKINGKPAKADARLRAGDEIELYISDEFFVLPKRADAFLSAFKWRLSIVYEDAHILIADKRPGLLSHPDAREKVDTLLNHMRAYLYQKGEWDSMDGEQFAPVLVNRIDRFTGGLVICAKTREAMNALNQKIRAREIDKRYLCVVAGALAPERGMLDNYILKDERLSRVSVLNSPAPGAKRAQTKYAALARSGAHTLLECRLITGRTHQIRAQLAHAGHPILGDKQYGGRDAANARAYQALYAYRIDFAFKTGAGALDALNGRVVKLKSVPFINDYFPGYQI